ncbi:MAG: glycosyltransferase [Planctomycetota bacterium]
MTADTTHERDHCVSQPTAESPLGRQHSITLVIPGRNCHKTLERCLASVVPLKESGELLEIIFVDDGSTDATAEIANRYPVTVLAGTGQGPGAARNLGWRSTQSELVWFIDSDCVAEPKALENLVCHLKDADVAGAGGSYANLFPNSLIASLIHEEIVSRHLRMRENVDFLATFNVLYRRSVLNATNGFNEKLKLAQDAEFAYRVRDHGYRLRFEMLSRVGHHHPRSLWRYLKTQARQGFYRVMLYRAHPSKASGDSYAGILDFLPPILGALIGAITPFALIADSRLGFILFVLGLLLVALQIPITIKLVRQSGTSMLNFLWLGSLRAVARGMGLAWGAGYVLIDTLFGQKRVSTTSQPSPEPSPRSTPESNGCSSTVE